MFCSNSARLASPDLRALAATAALSLPDPTAVPIATACPLLRKICTVDSVERDACSNLSNRASRSGVEGRGELFAKGGILIDLRRGLDVDGRLRGIEAGGQEHQQCKTKHARTPSDCKS